MKNIYMCFWCLMVVGILDLQAQCYPDRHNTTWYDGWISCDLAESPNPERGLSHWILYNLGSPYTLGKSRVWNSNHPDFLGRGLKDIVIDYSMDGVSWNEHGPFTLNQASGNTTYEGDEGPDFNKIEAQYVLITALSNYGGSCYGLSEFRFGPAQKITTTPTHQTSPDLHCMSVSIYPNPFEGAPNIDIKANCKDEIPLKLTDALGKELLTGNWIGASQIDLSQSEIESYPAGIYFLVIGEGATVQKHKLMKMK